MLTRNEELSRVQRTEYREQSTENRVQRTEYREQSTTGNQRLTINVERGELREDLFRGQRTTALRFVLYSGVLRGSTRILLCS